MYNTGTTRMLSREPNVSPHNPFHPDWQLSSDGKQLIGIPDQNHLIIFSVFMIFVVPITIGGFAVLKELSEMNSSGAGLFWIMGLGMLGVGLFGCKWCLANISKKVTTTLSRAGVRVTEIKWSWGSKKMQEKTWSHHEFAGIIIAKSSRYKHHDQQEHLQDFYLVQLRPRRYGPRINLFNTPSLSQAKAMAEKFSVFLNYKLIEETSTGIRPVGEFNLDRQIQELQSKTQTQRQIGNHLPAKTIFFEKRWFLVPAIGLILSLGTVFFMHNLGDDALPAVVISGIIALFCHIAFIKNVTSQVALEIEDSGLKHVKIWSSGRRQVLKQIYYKDITDAVVMQEENDSVRMPKRLSLKTRKGPFEFGRSLSEPELNQILQIILLRIKEAERRKPGSAA